MEEDTNDTSAAVCDDICRQDGAVLPESLFAVHRLIRRTFTPQPG